MCPNVTKNYAFFQETPVGRENPGFEEHYGVCVPNAAEKTRPKYLCQSDGVWIYGSGGCECLSGYEGQGENACVGEYFFLDLVSLLRNAYILLKSLKIFYQYKQYQQSALI